MGTTSGSTGGTGRNQGIVQPSFVLVGAPDTNKERIADELARDYFTEDLAVARGVLGSHFALGMLADYRAECLLMTQRATMLHSTDRATLYTHSLIDSLAYSLARVDNQQRNQNVSVSVADSWALTMGLAGCMLRDTFKADEIFYLVGDFDPETHYDNAQIEEIFGFILDGFEMNYHVLSATEEDVIDNIADIIRPYFAQS